MCKIMGFSNYVYNQTFQDPNLHLLMKKFKLGFANNNGKIDNTTLITNKYNTTESLNRIEILIPAAKIILIARISRLLSRYTFLEHW